MKKIITLLVIIICSHLQAQNLNDPLPINDNIKKGVLPNGLTYYIYSTDVVKNVASYYIIQNVGSVLENDDQQGLAHFLEHMAFNGTKNFEGKGILNTMQKHGLVFGRDINAYTSFDETVYNINHIPTTPELIDTGLLILHDWSNYLSLTDKEIDAERGVIKEEWRTRQNGRMRVLEQSLPVMYNNTIYAKRLPIGKMDIIDNFKYETLRNFYHDWYRTDLQAIAIIGDIDISSIEEKIKKIFSSIPANTNPRKRFVIDIPDNDELLYSLTMDKEVTTSQINFSIRNSKSMKAETIADLKESLLSNMAVNMLSARINEITQKPDAPFLNTSVRYSSNSRTINAFSLYISPKPNEQHLAFKTVLEEVNRAVKFGFTKEEINRTITQFKNYYETEISKEQDKPHRSIISTIKRNYLENITMTDIQKEYELIQKILDGLENDEVHNRIKELYKKENRSLIVTGVEGNNNLTNTDAIKIINTVEKDDTLTPYSDKFGNKTLLSNIDIKKGIIISEEENTALGSTTFKLSNGITVHYKFADKNKNDVKLQAISNGGMSLIKDIDLPSASLVTNVVGQSGLGDYAPTELKKILAGETASTNIDISDITESIWGSSITKDVETMLQMIHLRFVKPRFDNDAYKVFMNKVNNYLISRSKNINEKIKDSLTTTLYGKHNKKHRIFNNDFLKDVSFNKVKSIYLERYNNASDFEFFIVGDVQKEKLKPLLENYIASIPTKTVKEDWKNTSTDWISNSIDKDIYLKMKDPKSSVRIAYKSDYPYSLKTSFVAKTVKDILALRFTETLREEEGGTYGARAQAVASKKPNEEASITVSFDCNPAKVEQLITIVHKEINKIAAGDINEEDLNKTIASYLKSRKQQKDKNRYDMNVLINYYREGYNMNDPKNFEDIVNAISIEDLKEFTRKILESNTSYEIVFKPKE